MDRTKVQKVKRYNKINKTRSKIKSRIRDKKKSNKRT